MHSGRGSAATGGGSGGGAAALRSGCGGPGGLALGLVGLEEGLLLDAQIAGDGEALGGDSLQYLAVRFEEGAQVEGEFMDALGCFLVAGFHFGEGVDRVAEHALQALGEICRCGSDASQ